MTDNGTVSGNMYVFVGVVFYCCKRPEVKLRLPLLYESRGRSFGERYLKVGKYCMFFVVSDTLINQEDQCAVSSTF